MLGDSASVHEVGRTSFRYIAMIRSAPPHACTVATSWNRPDKSRLPRNRQPLRRRRRLHRRDRAVWPANIKPVGHCA